MGEVQDLHQCEIAPLLVIVVEYRFNLSILRHTMYHKSCCPQFLVSLDLICWMGV